MYSQTDINVAHRYKFGRDNKYAIEASLNITNLWDQKTVTSYFTTMGNKSVYSFLANYGYGCASGDFPCLLNKFNSGDLYDDIVANLTTNDLPTDPRISSSTGLPINLTPINRNALDERYGKENGYQGPRGVRFGFRFFF